MSNVKDLFDEPIDSILNRRVPSPVLISDDDDDIDLRETSDVGLGAQKVQPPSELDALFAELGDLDAPTLDFEALRKQAASKYASRGPSKRADVLLDDLDVSMRPGGTNDKDEDKGDEEKEKKPRKPMVKLDEERLLGPNGFPALLVMHKTFKPKPKGNESKDLQRLLQMYQLWAHKMYPKTKFRDTAEKVEKLCRSRQMQSAMSGWRDEIHKKDNPDPEPIDVDDDDNEDDNSGEDATNARSSTTMAPTVGPASEANGMDDWDLDEAIAEDSASRRAETRSSVQPPAVPMGEDDFDMEAMIAQDALDQEEARNGQSSSRGAPSNSTTSPKVAPKAPPRPQVDEDDGWDSDIAKELELDPEADLEEQGQEQEKISKDKGHDTAELEGPMDDGDDNGNGIGAENRPSTVAEKLRGLTDDAGTWDDMYVD